MSTDGHHRLNDAPVAGGIVLRGGAQVDINAVIVQDAGVTLSHFDGLLDGLVRCHVQPETIRQRHSIDKQLSAVLVRFRLDTQLEVVV